MTRSRLQQRQAAATVASSKPQQQQQQQDQQQQFQQRKASAPKSMKQMKEHVRTLEQKNNNLYNSKQQEIERANVAEEQIDTYKQRSAYLSTLVEEAGINSISGQKVPEATEFKQRLEELKNYAHNRLEQLDQNLGQLNELMNRFNECNPNESVDLKDSMMTN